MVVGKPGLEARKGSPTYVGDDRTVEDGFRELEQRGVSIHVSEQPRSISRAQCVFDRAEVERFLPELIEMTKLE